MNHVSERLARVVPAIGARLSPKRRQPAASTSRDDGTPDPGPATDGRPPLRCNICGSLKFKKKPKTGERVRCAGCKSLVRHRVAYATYRSEGVLERDARPMDRPRILHIAPEKSLHGELMKIHGPGYICADAVPEEYDWAKCVRLILPQDLMAYPDGYFDFILHNHILEHVPGHFKDHILALCRVLKPGGKMIFSVPGPDLSRLTVEGGEHLEDDAERLEKFGQYNHVRKFGRDLPEFMESLDGSFHWDEVSWSERQELGASGPGNARVMVWQKSKTATATRFLPPDTPEMSQAIRAGVRRPDEKVRKSKPVDTTPAS